MSVIPHRRLPTVGLRNFKTALAAVLCALIYYLSLIHI